MPYDERSFLNGLVSGLSATCGRDNGILRTFSIEFTFEREAYDITSGTNYVFHNVEFHASAGIVFVKRFIVPISAYLRSGPLSNQVTVIPLMSVSSGPYYDSVSFGCLIKAKFLSPYVVANPICESASGNKPLHMYMITNNPNDGNTSLLYVHSLTAAASDDGIFGASEWFGTSHWVEATFGEDSVIYPAGYIADSSVDGWPIIPGHLKSIICKASDEIPVLRQEKFPENYYPGSNTQYFLSEWS